MIYDRLPVGTLVEVLRSKLVGEICVVTNESPLILRPATAWERMRWWYKSRRAKAGELSAAAEAIAAIESAKERA